MTLLDLCTLLKKNWLIVVAVPVACALACFAVMELWPPVYAPEASLAGTGATPPKSQYVIIAFLAGVLAALAIVIIKDMAHGAVHNACEVEENYDLRLLGSVRSTSARRRSSAAAEDAALLAALDFAGAHGSAGEGPAAICLVPIEDAESAKRIVDALEAAAESAGKHLVCESDRANLAPTGAIVARTPSDADLVLVMAPPVAQSADFAYLAPECGCAVLVVDAMRTTHVRLEAALRQLSLSETPIAGFIMVNAA